MRILGLDVGEQRIGIALSDPAGRLALGLTTLEVHDPKAKVRAIQRLVEENQAELVVVGLPLSLDGQLHGQGQRVKGFAERLSKALSVPVRLWDERLSTVEAGQRLREAGVRGGRKKANLDMTAATLVLQTYLDRRLSEKTRENGACAETA